MRRKGYPHGELSDEEKAFFTRRRTSIAERRQKRERRRKIDLENKGETESAEHRQAA